jgi:hypothetical protein
MAPRVVLSRSLSQLSCQRIQKFSPRTLPIISSFSTTTRSSTSIIKIIPKKGGAPSRYIQTPGEQYSSADYKFSSSWRALCKFTRGLKAALELIRIAGTRSKGEWTYLGLRPNLRPRGWKLPSSREFCFRKDTQDVPKCSCNSRSSRLITGQSRQSKC